MYICTDYVVTCTWDYLLSITILRDNSTGEKWWIVDDCKHDVSVGVFKETQVPKKLISLYFVLKSRGSTVVKMDDGHFMSVGPNLSRDNDSLYECEKLPENPILKAYNTLPEPEGKLDYTWYYHMCLQSYNYKYTSWIRCARKWHRMSKLVA